MKTLRLDGWLLTGIVAYGAFAPSLFLDPGLALLLACIGMAIAGFAGYRQASSDSFFTGMALGVGIWIALLFIDKGVEAVYAVFLTVPFSFVAGFVMAAVGFFAGRGAARLVARGRQRG